jgi:HEAT repeat protein
MNVQKLIERFAGSDPKKRRSAGDALVTVGEPAVGPVLALSCDEDSPVDWADSAIVLRRIGQPALEPLIEAMASAPTPRCRTRLD